MYFFTKLLAWKIKAAYLCAVNTTQRTLSRHSAAILIGASEPHDTHCR